MTPNDKLRDSVLNHIYTYASTMDTFGLTGKSSYAYTKFRMRTNHRNITLAMVPTLYTIAHGAGRQFIGEYYSKVTFGKGMKLNSQRMVHVTTVPHRKNAMSSVLTYLVPNVYGECLFQNNILSPFHRSNRKYYIYSVSPLPYGKAQVYVYPKIKNTQLVRSIAIVDSRSGKIHLVDFEGEYDMTRFFISITMNSDAGRKSLFPKKCDLRANFRFMGSQITGMYTSVYDLPKVLSDTLSNVSDTALMTRVRPIELNDEEKQVIQQYYQEKHLRDSLAASTRHKNHFAKDILWDVVGDNVLNRIKQNFGNQSQGYLRINPILNPLYMGYSHRKGLVYKFDMRGSYSFNDNMQLSLRLKAGYSFKLHQFYFRVPVILNYNKKHDGYLQIEVGNGNRISSNVVARRILDISKDKDSLVNLPYDKVTDFKDNYLRITNHWMLTPHWGFEVGIVGHHRVAVNPEFYRSNGFPASYRSMAPAVALEWYPRGTQNLILKIDYERSFKNFLNSNIRYERVEMDAQSIIQTSRRRSFSLRGGAGFYIQKGAHWDFVDYTNFRDDNIPGGWNDDWSGEFELLNSGWYNASDYYVRSNATYETPILLAAWLPWAGHFIEKERLYVNTLLVNHLHPYTEWGYGFTTRLLSIGAFAAFRNTKFEGIGCKFGFELFRNW